MSTSLRPVQSSGSFVHEPAANTDAVVTLTAAGENRHHVLSAVAFSYNGVPTGALTITDGGTTIFKVHILTKRAYFFSFVPALRCMANSEVVVTLAAGGSGVTGCVNVNTWVE